MAVKHWNSMKGGKYQIPKKGSKEYDEIKEVQNSMINGDGLTQLGGKAPDKKAPVKTPVKKAPKMKGGEIINPNIDLISEINDLWTSMIGLGMTSSQKNKLKKNLKGGSINPSDLFVVSRMSRELTKRAKEKGQTGGLGWAELSAVNEVLYPLQPKAPSLDTKTGKPVPPSTPFDFLNIKF